MKIGIAGEVRLVVRDSNNAIKQDTGYQKNLILNQGLDFFGGLNGAKFTDFCGIGAGNSQPLANQVSLDNYIAVTIKLSESDKRNYIEDGSGFYKTHLDTLYRFTGLSNVNISEVGLMSQHATSSSYYLCTRALIKDANGEAASISIKSGEILDVYYRVWKVYSTSDSSYVVNMIDGDGVSTPYNAVVRLFAAGSAIYLNQGKHYGVSVFGNDVDKRPQATSKELQAVNALPMAGPTSTTMTATVAPYIAGSYKVVTTYSLDLTQGNSLAIRTITAPSTMGFWQIRFGQVAGDTVIPKTSAHTLSMPFEVSWGRYEGEL